MNIRVVAGQYGGRTLEAPNTKRTHPMSERARNAIFNSLASEVLEANVLDAFAGTGALGIEALSRGAKSATFIERDRIAAKCLQNNIDSLFLSSQTKLVRTTVANWLETAELAAEYDLIFADPPYHDEQLSTVSRLLNLLKPGGRMVLSHTGKGEVPLRTNEIVVVDNRSYANAHLTFFRRRRGATLTL